MAATLDDIKGWLARADDDCTHMIVVCDNYDYEDYPVFVRKDQNVHEVVKKYNGVNMQSIMEVYNFSLDIPTQLKERRAVHY